MRKWYPS